MAEDAKDGHRLIIADDHPLFRGALREAVLGIGQATLTIALRPDLDAAALTTRLAGTQAELRDAMDGLRDSRNEVEDLRDYIEQALARR